MSRKKFVAIIAPARSGKTTVVRSLTGYDRLGGHGLVEDRATGHSVYTIAGSPQETGMSIEIFRRMVRDAALNRRCVGIVAAIQPTRPWSRVSLEQMFECVQEASAFEAFAYILNPTYSSEGVDVQSVRCRLSSFQTRIQTLDGRRFAHLNAQIIQAESGLLR